MSKRAERRHHYQRLKKTRKHYWAPMEGEVNSDKKLGMLANTPAPCSGECCGNPRKFYGETFREKDFNNRKLEEE